MPFVVESSAHICACMSVGKPGYGSVASSSALVSPLGEIEIESACRFNVENHNSASAIVTALTCSGSTRFIVTPFPANRARDQKCSRFDPIRDDVSAPRRAVLSRLR